MSDEPKKSYYIFQIIIYFLCGLLFAFAENIPAAVTICALLLQISVTYNKDKIILIWKSLSKDQMEVINHNNAIFDKTVRNISEIKVNHHYDEGDRV